MATLTTSYQMLAQTYVGNTGYADVYLRLYAKYNSQSIKDNNSSVSYKSTIYFGSGTFYTGNTTTKMLEGSGATTVSQDGAVTYYAGETTLNEISGTVWHNAEGKYTAWGKATFISTPWGWNAVAEATADLPTIPRYATSNQSLNSKTETTIKMNWSSDNTIDYIWYSKDGGTNWTGVDVTDGTSGTYKISGLTANTTYSIKTRVRRKDSQLTTDSSALSVTTYKVPSNSLNARTETTIKMNWSVDSTADYIWYSKDNGSTWTAVGSVSATSGTYTISGLSANTTYKIKTRVRRKATQTTYDTSAVSVTTYNYPYITSFNKSYVIGESNTITLYNPLKRNVTISLILNDGSDVGPYTFDGTSITGYDTEWWQTQYYSSIPNSKSGNYKIRLVCSSLNRDTTVNGGTYSIKGTETPTFTNFTYVDTDSTITPLTNNNQILVNGNSDCKFTVSTANKAVAKNSATMVSYKFEYGSKSTTADYSSSSDVVASLYDSTGGTLKVTAIDSRGLSTTVTKTVPYIAYTNAVVNSVEIQRLNGVDLETYLGLKMTIWKGNWQNGSDTAYDNQLKYVGYRVHDGSSWTSYFDITSIVKSNMSSSTSGSSTVITVPLSKKMAIHANDTSGGFTVGKEYKIQILIKDGTSTTTFTPYSYQATAQGTVPDGKVGFSRYKDSNGNYHYAINSMPDDSFNFKVNGNSKFSKSHFILLSLERLETPYAAAIEFKNKNGVLGYIGMSETPNGGLLRYLADISANYLFLDTGNYKNYVLPKSGGTVTGELIAGNGSVWASTTSAKEVQCGVQKATGVNAGSIYLYSNGSTTGGRGIYTINNNGYGHSVLSIDANNNVNLNGTATTATKVTSSNVEPSSGTTYYPVYSTGSGTSQSLMLNAGLQFYVANGTTSTVGRSLLSLGNNISSGTAGNKRGEIKIFSEKSGCTRVHAYPSQTGDFTVYLPYHSGYLLCATSLYNNTSGTTGTITLSESAANFTYLEIFYGKTTDYLNSVRIHQASGKKVALSISYYDNNSTYSQLLSKQISISGTSITNVSGQSGFANIYASNHEVGSANQIYIYKVTGYM